MMWIIASLPFWSVGLAINYVTVRHLWLSLPKVRTPREVGDNLLGFAVLNSIAGVFFIIGAKVGS